MKLTKRRAAKARLTVYAGQCPARAGVYMHDWKFSYWGEMFDYTRGTPAFRVYECTFCHIESS